jgi:hypothetical protein
MKIDDKKDYSTSWIELQVEVRLMHNFFLQGRWKDAGDCANKAKELCINLKELCDEMDSIPE